MKREALGSLCIPRPDATEALAAEILRANTLTDRGGGHSLEMQLIVQGPSPDGAPGTGVPLVAGPVKHPAGILPPWLLGAFTLG